MTIADSFADPVFFNEQLTAVEEAMIEELTPRQKMFVFVQGMMLNSIDLIEFRNASETRALVAEHEGELWSILNAVQCVLTSIRVERDQLPLPALKVVQ